MSRCRRRGIGGLGVDALFGCGSLCLVMFGRRVRSSGVKKTSTRLADGRELIYYDSRDDAVRDAVDQRPLDPIATASEIRHDPLLGDCGRHRLAPPGPHLPPAGRRVPAVPLARRAAQRDPRPPTTTSPSSRTASPRSAGRLAGPLRGRLLHLRPRRLLRRPHRGAGRGWSWTPGPTAPPSCPNCPAWSRSSASRTAARRSASPSATRTARSTPIPSPPRAPR